MTAPTNRLLDGLPVRSRALVLASSRSVELEFARVLYQAGDPIRHVYFPVTGFISLINTLRDGSSLEVGIVGDEGMLGLPGFLGNPVSLQRALVQGAGAALRIELKRFGELCARLPALRRTLGLYIQLTSGELAQTAVCARFHRVEARLARWLLMSRDRAHSDSFRLTHEFMAYMLGVRRVGITEAAGALQARGLIVYRRGNIAIRDAAALERSACGCYRDGRALYEQVLGGASRTRRATRSALRRARSATRLRITA